MYVTNAWSDKIERYQKCLRSASVVALCAAPAKPNVVRYDGKELVNYCLAASVTWASQLTPINIIVVAMHTSAFSS